MLVARPETEILYDITKFLGEHSSAEHLAPLVRQMVARVAEEEEEGVRYLLRCLRILVLLKGGKLVQEPEALVRLLEETTVGSVEVVELATAIATAPKLLLPARRVEELLGHLLTTAHLPLASKLALVTEFAEHHLFTSCLLRPYMVVVQEEVGVRRSREVVAHLATTVRRLAPPCTRGSELLAWRPAAIDLHLVREVRALPRELAFPAVLADLLLPGEPAEVVTDALAALAAVTPVDKELVLARIGGLVSSFSAAGAQPGAESGAGAEPAGKS